MSSRKELANAIRALSMDASTESQIRSPGCPNGYG
ncbi:transketolase [Salmonella bongori]|nr:transketolase [Salmonella bongori]